MRPTGLQEAGENAGRADAVGESVWRCVSQVRQGECGRAIPAIGGAHQAEQRGVGTDLQYLALRGNTVNDAAGTQDDLTDCAVSSSPGRYAECRWTSKSRIGRRRERGGRGGCVERIRNARDAGAR